ncbi:terminase small subunit [Chromobacterium violaceum]|uniref:terminase small subunit n=1 Tax=Chromobacterium violaceum TaxID=536 RepID=UPI00194DCB44|nr:terminase small subunit [Chromobacterium violaceum]QRO34140.1 terminase small subunit [Chromobacterium violaceum]QRQ16057.1 terminase small subunit [Chromobacterium violaceum]
MGKIVNKRELAQILDTSERTLTEWQRQGMPMAVDAGRGSANQYDTGDVIRWRIAREANGEKESAKDRLDRLRGDQVELDLLEARRVLVNVAEIEPALGQFIADAVALMVSMPDKYAPLLGEMSTADDIHAALTEMMEELRQQLGRYEFRNDRDSGAAAEADATAAKN